MERTDEDLATAMTAICVCCLYRYVCKRFRRRRTLLLGFCGCELASFYILYIVAAVTLTLPGSGTTAAVLGYKYKKRPYEHLNNTGNCGTTVYDIRCIYGYRIIKDYFHPNTLIFADF